MTRVRRSPPLPHTLPSTSLHLSTPRSMTFSAECGRMWTVTLGHRMGSLSMAREGQTEAEASLAFGGLPALVPRMSESARCSVHLGVHLRLPHGLGQVGESHRRRPSPGVSMCTRGPAPCGASWRGLSLTAYHPRFILIYYQT